jgi:hypothetical protein
VFWMLGLLMFLKMVKTYNSPRMFVFLCLARFRWKMICFMNEMRLENSFRLTGFTYVFEHDHKFNSVLQFLYVWRRLNGKVVFVNGISVKRVFVNDWFYPCFWRWLKMQWSVDVRVLQIFYVWPGFNEQQTFLWME